MSDPAHNSESRPFRKAACDSCGVSKRVPPNYPDTPSTCSCSGHISVSPIQFPPVETDGESCELGHRAACTTCGNVFRVQGEPNLDTVWCSGRACDGTAVVSPPEYLPCLDTTAASRSASSVSSHKSREPYRGGLRNKLVALAVAFPIFSCVLCGFLGKCTPDRLGETAGEYYGSAASESGHVLRGGAAVSSTRAIHDRLSQFVAADDELGIRQLLLSGLVWTTDRAISVKVITSHGFLPACYEVRIMEGPHQGELGFVQSDAVRD